MKLLALLFLPAISLLVACSAGNPALRTAQMQSELSYAEGERAKFDAKKLDAPKSTLDSSKQAEKVKDDQLALVLAELSNVEYRVIFAEARLDSLKMRDKSVRNALMQDKENLKKYKEELKQETEGKSHE